MGKEHSKEKRQRTPKSAGAADLSSGASKERTPVDPATKAALRSLSTEEALRVTEYTALALDEVNNLHVYFQKLEQLDGSAYEEGVTKAVFLQHCLQVELDHADAAAALFDLFDMDHSGRISFAELALFTSLMAKGTTDEKLANAFKAFDRNGDGHLDRGEIRAMLQSSLRLAETLCIANKDETAQLSATPEASRAITEQHVDEVLADVDTNHNGQIEASEFVARGQYNKYIKRVLDFFFCISNPTIVRDRRMAKQAERKKRREEAAAAATAGAGTASGATTGSAAPTQARDAARSGSGSGSGSSDFSYSSFASSDL